MKRMMIAMIAGMFLLAAVPAMADHRVWQGPDPNYTLSVGGQIEIDGWLKSKYPAFEDETLRYYNQETRLFFKGQWADIEMMVRMEFDYDWAYGNQNKGNTTQNPLDLAWLKFTVPGTPVVLKAGLQPIIFGKSILIDDDVYALLATVPIDKMAITLGTIKWTETYLDREDFDSYLALFSTSAIPNNSLAALFLYNDDKTNDGKWWDLGLYLEGSAAPIGYWVEGHLQGGSLSDDVDLQAYALAGGLKAGLGAADVTLWGVIGSGDNDDDDTYKAFVPVSPYFQPDIVVVFDSNGKSISNCWALGLRGDFKPMPQLSIWGQVGFYNRVKEVVEDEKYIGTEFDLVGVYKIADNLTWKLALGYLVSGDGLAEDFDENPISLNNEWMLTF